MDKFSKEELIVPPYKTKEELEAWIKRNKIGRVRRCKPKKKKGR